MSLITQTPRTAWHLALIAAVVYASAPLFTVAYYSEMLRKGAYPPEADSIGIPIFENLIGTALLTPSGARK